MNMNNYTIGWIIVAVLVVGTGIYMAQKRSPQEPELSDANPRVVQSHRSFVLRSDAAETYKPNTPTSYTFSVVDDQGTTVKDFLTVHEKIMHVIIVRKDLTEFQHVHPDFNKMTGEFTLSNLVFPSEGPYRIFADFTPKGTQMGPGGMPLGVTLSEDVVIGNISNYKPQQLVVTDSMQTVTGYQVQLSTNPVALTAQGTAMVSYTITKDGKPVTNLEKYLGALGHSVVLSEGDLDFIHAHALNEDVKKQNGTVDFHVAFPKAGNYKIFTQFQHQGKVITISYVVNVQTAQSTSGSMPGMDHSMH